MVFFDNAMWKERSRRGGWSEASKLNAVNKRSETCDGERNSKERRPPVLPSQFGYQIGRSRKKRHDQSEGAA